MICQYCGDEFKPMPNSNENETLFGANEKRQSKCWLKSKPRISGCGRRLNRR